MKLRISQTSDAKKKRGDFMELSSQGVRALAPENDPLEIGMGWEVKDLDKPQIMIESTFGDSHPGSAHSGQLVDETMRGIADAGGKGARYFTTDICNGIAQGHGGINYLLARRDTVANMIEIHDNSTGSSGGAFIASCDESVPACLIELARLDMPSIVVTGGVMDAGPDLLTLGQIGAYSAMCQRGEITEEKPTYYRHSAYPSCGACSFMGTASIMQIMAESLGLMLPGSALMPATCTDLREMTYKAGLQVMELAGKGLKVNDIMAMRSFENAIMVHAVISGSTNSLLHVPTIAHELGSEIDADTFDCMHRGARCLLDIRPAGKWPAQFFYYAGDVPAAMEEIKSILHLDVMAVIRRTLGGNLEEFKVNEFYDKCNRCLKKWNLKRTDVIWTFEEPIGADETVAVLEGDLAPEGSIMKHSAVPREMFRTALGTKSFDCEEGAIEAIISRGIQPGDAMFIRYEGPRESGMPEMFYITEAISFDPELGKTIALITDGRLSGASKGPAIKHISPEATDGGPIALTEEDNLIRVDIPERVLEVIDVRRKELPGEEVGRIPAERGEAWKPRETKYKKGVFKICSGHAVSSMKGGYMV